MSFVSTVLRSWKGKCVLAGLVLVFIFVSLLPVGVKLYLRSWLMDNGADTVKIDDIDINLFTGTVRLKGIDVRKGEKVVFGNSDIMVDIGLKNLLQKNLLLEEAGLQDVVIDIEQTPKGDLRIGSYSSKASTDPKAEKQPAEPIPAWTFTAKKISLDKVDVHYKMAELDINTHIEHMVLERFTTGAEQFNGRLEFVGTVNDSPVTLALDKLDVRNGVAFSGDITLTDFLLNNLGALLEKQAGLQQLAGTAGLEGKVDFQLDSAGNIIADYDGALELNGLDLAQQDAAVSGSMQWQGKTTVQLDHGKTRVDLNGELALADTHAALADETAFSVEKAVMNADTELVVDSALQYGGKAQITIDQFSMTRDAERLISFASLALAAEKNRSDDAFSVRDIALEDLNLPPSSLQPYAIDAQQLSVPAVEGTLDLASLTITSPVISQLILSQQPQLKVTLASVSSPAVELMTTDSLVSPGVNLGGVTVALAGPQQADIDLKELSLSKLSYGPDSGAVIDAVVLDLLKADLVAQQKSETEAKTGPPSGSRMPAAEGDSSDAVALQIGSVTVTRDSVFSYRDETLPKPFSVKARVEELQVKDIDLKNSQKPIQYVAKMMIDEYGHLTVDGQLSLEPEMRLEQKLRLKNYPATGISPFLEAAAGNRVESGRVQFSSDLMLEGKSLKTENQVTLNEFQTSIADDEQADSFNAHLPLPLDTALYMIRDDDDAIVLSIPVNGELGDMKVGIQDILTTAISKSLTVAVTPYLAYTFLGPTGALVYLGAMVGKELLETDLPVIEFKPGQREIGQDQFNRLNSVGESLRESFAGNEESDISLCAKVQADETADQKTSLSDEETRKKLFELGDARAAAVKKYLVDTYSLDPERLQSCSPGLLFEKDEQPYVQFME